MPIKHGQKTRAKYLGEDASDARYLTVERASRLFSISPATFYNAFKDPEHPLRSLKLAGKRLLRPEDIEAWIAGKAVWSGGPAPAEARP
jgi:predicted DNA-binding transcriptional regulator AlpA